MKMKCIIFLNFKLYYKAIVVKADIETNRILLKGQK